MELRFTVPASSRKKLRADLVGAGDAFERTSLATLHLDTGGGHLALAGLQWRLRRDGRRWTQTLRTKPDDASGGPLHQVARPRGAYDASAHAGTSIGERLVAVLNDASREGAEIRVRSKLEVQHAVRLVRTAGASVQVSVDQGRMLLDGAARPMFSVEFRLVSGSIPSMLACVERWRKRYGLQYDPRSEAEQLDQLASTSGFPPLRKAQPPSYARDAAVLDGFGVVLDECLAHVTRNAVGLCDGDPVLRVEHVHQLRVGIRRLRSALRSFRDWTPEPAAELVERLRVLFAALGRTRDADVLSSGVMAELQRVGAPMPTLRNGGGPLDAAEAVRADEVQRMFLGWIAWRAALADNPAPAPGRAATAEPAAGEGSTTDAPPRKHTLRRGARRRLRRWHGDIAAAWHDFDRLDPTALHVLRKRIKRQRYAVEFFAPVLKRRPTKRYIKALTAIQERMGGLNDLFVAQEHYRAMVANEPTALFALGWLVARIEVVRSLAKPELGKLAEETPPS